MSSHPELRRPTPEPRRRAPALPPLSFVPAFLAVLTLVTLACDGGEPAPGQGEDTGAAADAVTRAESEAIPVQDAALRDAVVAEARPVAAALMQTLSGQLRTAMDEGGAVGAMDFCNVAALPLTQEVAEERGMEVKRTSLRLRNPDNAPDTAESRALAHYREAVEAGRAPPESHVQAMPDGSYRYYQPLVTADFCLQCHGDPEDLATGVAEALRDLYPRDEATGYGEGEWRGLVRVSVPEAAVAGR